MALAGNCSTCQKLLGLKSYEEETPDSLPGIHRLIKAVESKIEEAGLEIDEETRIL